MKKAFSGLIALLLSAFQVFSGLSFAAAETIGVEDRVKEEAVEETVLETEISGASLTYPAWVNESALDENYINAVMPHKTTLRVSRLSGILLPEPNRSLYSALRERVIAVASGALTSTEFTFPYGDIFQNTFTAEEMAERGVESILEDGAITVEAKAAALEAMQQNRSKINATSAIQCLLNDCPFELYWYDKDAGGTKVSYVSSTYSATSKSITVNGNIVVRMSVSMDYAASTISGGSTAYSQYETDRRYGASVQAAAENAAQILALYDGLTDYEKLCGYRNAICSFADYNYDAEAQDAYGDPWQIVWVFDGKPNTKVVCEGYAKAFQYLAGLGTSSATVISAQGRTTGAHMWNVVHIDNHNYLADLTACDAGLDLFMKGFTDGSVADGYSIGTRRYVYNEGLEWGADDLTLAGFDYSDWLTATTKAPSVIFSSEVTFSGYQIAVIVDGIVPVSALIASIGEEERTIALDNGAALLDIEEGGEIIFSALIDDVVTPATEAATIVVSEFPESGILIAPGGSEIQAEAFSGINAEAVVLEGNIVRADAFNNCPNLAVAIVDETSVIATGAFEPSVVLAVRDVGDWFNSGYHFVVAEREQCVDDGR